MAYEKILSEIVQISPQLYSLGLFAFGAICSWCGKKIAKSPCPDCGCPTTQAKKIEEEKKMVKRITEIYPDGLPTCGGTPFDEGGEGGGGASKNITLYRPK